MQVNGKEQQVLLYLTEKIKNGHYSPGAEFISEQWVTKKLNVSLVTVRKAFATLAEYGVINRSQGRIATLSMNYEDRLYRMKTGNEGRKLSIGLIFPEASEFFPKVIEGIEQESLHYSCNLNFSLNSTQELETMALERCFEEKTDGVIITPVRHYSVKNYTKLMNSGIPFVMVGKPPAQIIGNSVYSNDVYSSYDAANILFGRGCVSLAHITYTRLDAHTSSERYLGFESALKEKGFDGQRYLFDFDREGEDDRFFEFLVHHNEKIGVLLSDDLSAPQVYSLIEKSGKRVGDNVLVIGYNNTKICEKLPVTLTAVNLNWREIGRQAMKNLLKQITGDVEIGKSDYVIHYIVNHEIVFRQSCKK